MMANLSPFMASHGPDTVVQLASIRLWLPLVSRWLHHSKREVVDPYGEECGNAARLEPRGRETRDMIRRMRV